MDETVEPAPAPDAPAAAPEGVATVDAFPADAAAARLPLPAGAALVLASLCAGAGIIHLVMAPIHASSSAVEAAAFALAGWVQLGLAYNKYAKASKKKNTTTPKKKK